jgi:predicted cupin superfamily sugar epimerase
MSPGFDSADFELGNRAELVARFPARAGLITALTSA